jgi:hypothetical protein
MTVRKEKETPMIRLLLGASIAIHDVLRRYMPTNVIRDLVRTRRGLKWGVPAMLLAAPYVFSQVGFLWLVTYFFRVSAWSVLLVIGCGFPCRT